MASPTDYRGSKPTDSQKKKNKKPNPNTMQITKSEIASKLEITKA